jgi:hypothetical protein
MELYLINGMMASALVFAFYITQADRNYFCKRQLEKFTLWVQN